MFPFKEEKEGEEKKTIWVQSSLSQGLSLRLPDIVHYIEEDDPHLKKYWEKGYSTHSKVILSSFLHISSLRYSWNTRWSISVQFLKDTKIEEEGLEKRIIFRFFCKSASEQKNISGSFGGLERPLERFQVFFSKRGDGLLVGTGCKKCHTSCLRNRRWSWWPRPTRTRRGSTWSETAEIPPPQNKQCLKIGRRLMVSKRKRKRKKRERERQQENALVRLIFYTLKSTSQFILGKYNNSDQHH